MEPYGGRMSGDGVDVGIQDEVLMEEIELVADLVVAASGDPHRHLSLEEIDRALGL
jgi:hypothetical protein